MTVIRTRYLPATTSRGSRVKATAAFEGRSVTLQYDYALSSYANHIAAARALAEREGLAGKFFEIDGAGEGCLFAHWPAVHVGFVATPAVDPVEPEASS